MYKNIRQKPRPKSRRDESVRRRRAAGAHPAEPRLATVARLLIVPRNRLHPGTVVWARIPFEDVEGYKIRPGIVLRCHGRDVILLPCTTSLGRHQRPGHVEIKHWQAAGLPRPTGVRRASITVDYLEVVNIVGDLADEDAAALLPTGARLRRLLPLADEGDSAA